jgi:hypothetical protein
VDIESGLSRHEATQTKAADDFMIDKMLINDRFNLAPRNLASTLLQPFIIPISSLSSQFPRRVHRSAMADLLRPQYLILRQVKITFFEKVIL